MATDSGRCTDNATGIEHDSLMSVPSPVAVQEPFVVAPGSGRCTVTPTEIELDSLMSEPSLVAVQVPILESGHEWSRVASGAILNKVPGIRGCRVQSISAFSLAAHRRLAHLEHSGIHQCIILKSVRDTPRYVSGLIA